MMKELGLGDILRALALAVFFGMVAFELAAGLASERCQIASVHEDIDVMRIDGVRCEVELTCPSGTKQDYMSRRGGRRSKHCPKAGEDAFTSPMWPRLPPLVRSARAPYFYTYYPLSGLAGLLLVLSWPLLGRFNPRDIEKFDPSEPIEY